MSFDSTTGLASFSNLSLTAQGVYLLQFTVTTTNNDFKLTCLSQQITIKNPTAVFPSYREGTRPGYSLKFKGEYSSIRPQEVLANMYNFMNLYNINVAGAHCYSGSVYVSFYSVDTSILLINSLVASGVTIDPNLQFMYANVFNTLFNCTSCLTELTNLKTDALASTISTTQASKEEQVNFINIILFNSVSLK